MFSRLAAEDYVLHDALMDAGNFLDCVIADGIYANPVHPPDRVFKITVGIEHDVVGATIDFFVDTNVVLFLGKNEIFAHMGWAKEGRQTGGCSANGLRRLLPFGLPCFWLSRCR